METSNVKGCLIGLLMILGTFSCNSKSGNGSDLEDFFGGSADVDIEQLRYDLNEDIVDSTEAEEFLKDSDFPQELNESFLSFYKNREFLPAWIDEDGINDQAEDLLSAIEKSVEHGLSAEDYKLAYLQHLKKKLDSEDAELREYQKLDKELTAAYLKFANHLLRGRIDPQSLDALWITNRRQKDLASHLQAALENEEIQESLLALEPQYEGYKKLKKAFATYKKLGEEHKKWITLPKEIVLKPGDSSRSIPQIARTLMVLGDFDDKHEGELYSEELEEAVKSFQIRHGLEADGIIAGNTISMLNISPARRAEQIKLNLERFRWLPEKPEERHVVVNIPEFRAYIYEGIDSVFSMKVIVGKAYESTTPIFNDTIEYITFSPNWTVPLSIATEEMLPALQKDPDYLASRGFKLYESWEEEAEEIDAGDIDWEDIKPEEFTYRIVQNPGERNSLGRVKFMFPNKMDIYLHDTPADYLFNKAERDFSHGCIRVEKPVEFAEYLLKEQKFDRPTIEDYMSREEPVEVPLVVKVPVLIEYRTAWVGTDEQMNFREDIYGHDQKQLGTLQKAVAKLVNKE